MRFSTQSFYDTYISEEGEFDLLSLANLIKESYSESDDLDFKEKWISEDKIAKIIIAMANSGGGAIIFGISDDKKPVGIEDIPDTTDYLKKINSYLPTQLKFKDKVIEYADDAFYGDLKGKKFLIFYTQEQNRFIPFLPKKEGGSIKPNTIYMRKNAAVEVANNEDLEKMFKLRLVEQYENLSNMELEDHLKQLKVLYGSINKEISSGLFDNIGWTEALNIFHKKRNENYPKEDYDAFINRMIKKKKSKIEKILEVDDIK